METPVISLDYQVGGIANINWGLLPASRIIEYAHFTKPREVRDNKDLSSKFMDPLYSTWLQIPSFDHLSETERIQHLKPCPMGLGELQSVGNSGSQSQFCHLTHVWFRALVSSSIKRGSKAKKNTTEGNQ